MTSNLSCKLLFEGSWWALQQAGRLLRSAVLLYDNGDHSSAIALAMFGREEVGKCQLLRDAGLAVVDGQQITPRDMSGLLYGHTDKQAASMKASFSTSSAAPELAEALHALGSVPTGSPEWVAANAIISQHLAHAREEQPKQNHVTRTKSLYVDLSADGATWLQPNRIPIEDARHLVIHAVNSYSALLMMLTSDSVRPIPGRFKGDVDPMKSARERMLERVELPAPVFPRKE